MAVGRSVAPERWSDMLEEVLARVAGRFPRVEPRRRVRGFVLGLLADLPRKNCWTITEHSGDTGPDGMQHLLGRAVWDTDGVRDDVRDYVVEHLGDPHGVLVVDETGDVKKGAATVGTQRQYTPAAGRVENAQVTVYVTYAGQARHTMIDRELYLPKSWTNDPARCAAAGVPEDVEFATKPQLAATMLGRFWTPECRRGGWPPMRSMAPIPGWAPIWRPARWATCWPSAATAACPPRPARCGPTPSPPACPRALGCGSRPARVPRGSATTTGRGSP